MSRVEELLAHTRRDLELRKRKSIPQVPADDRRVRWNRSGFRIIAEIKRSSLSAGAIRPDLDLARLARSYEGAGAAAISVLTEPHFFGGSLQDLQTVRTVVSVPLLQKDFLIDPFQVQEAKSHGATFVLLIAGFLSKSNLREMLRACRQAKINAIVEITDEQDLGRLDEPVDFLGVNSRDLQTLEVDTTKFESLRNRLPDAFLIAESGIKTGEALDRVIGLGYNGALVGEHFLRAGDPPAELASFVRRSRSVARVKICGITNETDALLAVKAGASALGFIFAESPRRVRPENLAALRPKISPGITCVGVFLGQTKSQIEDAVRSFDLHVAQVYDDAQPDVPVWNARRVQKAPSLEEGPVVLWDVRSEESELPGIWRSLAERPVFAIAGGLHAGNVASAVEICQPVWVDVARGVELEPGIKDPHKLNRFMAALR